MKKKYSEVLREKYYKINNEEFCARFKIFVKNLFIKSKYLFSNFEIFKNII